jgi:peroxiredoxin Q/BCP
MNILSENELAPDFILPCETGEVMSIKDFKGKTVVLYFYPKDDTPGCTQQAKDFRDKIEEFIKLNAIVIGVSRDTIDRHEEFKKKYALPFSLISDEDGIALEEYGVWVEKNMYGKKYMGIERSTYLINREGKIKKIWRKVSVGGHVAEVLEAVRELEIESHMMMDKKLKGK